MLVRAVLSPRLKTKRPATPRSSRTVLKGRNHELVAIDELLGKYTLYD